VTYHHTKRSLRSMSSGAILIICAGWVSASIAAAPQSTGAAEATAGADAGLEEIVVTAQKTGATTLQKTPIAVSAFSTADLKTSLTTNIRDLVSYVPNVSLVQVQAVNASIYIRGVGTNNVFSGSDPDVTMQIDGVYIARSADTLADFLDVDRIEVLRGPQGTLYGRNAIGGTVNIISKKPSDTLTGQEELTVGNFGTVQEQAYISGPLVPGELQGSLAINYLRHDPYLKNLVPGANGVDDANHGGLRGQLRWEPTDTIDATTRFDASTSSENPNNYDVLVAPVAGATLANSAIGNFHRVAVDAATNDVTHSGGISEEINGQIDANLNLKSISAYHWTSYDTFQDLDGTELDITAGKVDEKEAEITQEFDLQMHYTDFEGVAGLYYFHDHESSDFTAQGPSLPPVPFLIEALPTTYSDAEAAFAQGTYHLTSNLALTAGLRYTLEDKHLQQDYQFHIYVPEPLVPPGSGFPFNGSVTRHYHGITPKFGVNWNVTDDAMLYVSATKGYKSGGVNSAAAAAQGESFNPETIWSYEIGAKTDWFDHRLRANLTGFKYNYSDLQVQSLIGPGLVSIGNAASAGAKGIEAELTAKPTPAWRLTTNLTYLSATYRTFAAASVPQALVPFVSSSPDYNAATGTFNASGKTLDAAPRYTAFVAAQHDWDLGNQGSIYSRAEYHWQDRVYFDPSNASVMSQGAYGLVNLFTGYNTADGLWQTQLYAKNVADKGYFISIAANGVAPFGLVGAPRTFGIQVTRYW
jgi:iron complex outermembrane recepter protein